MSYEDIERFRAGKLALGLEERGFEMVYDADTVLAKGHEESGYSFSVLEEEGELEAVMSVRADISEDNYTNLPSLEESLEAAGNPSQIDMKFNGERYFLEADLTDSEHVDEMLNAYDCLKNSGVV